MGQSRTWKKGKELGQKERTDIFASESFVFICCRRREMSLAMLASASLPFLPFVSASYTHPQATTGLYETSMQMAAYRKGISNWNTLKDK